MIQPVYLVVLFTASLLGIIFGALPGLTATLGVALLTTLTYGMKVDMALLSLIAIYVGGVFGGCYSSILLNIPGTSASAATAMEGFPLAMKGEAGTALGIANTASLVGGLIGMSVLMLASPLIATFALQFTSHEFFLLALFGIVISGTLTSKDLVFKGWIAGLLGLAMACVGRDKLQAFPRFTFGFTEIDSGLEVVPVLIGAFGIPQILSVLVDKFKMSRAHDFKKVSLQIPFYFRNLGKAIRSGLIGCVIGAVPGIGEDIAAWVSYGIAKNSSKTPEKFGHGEPTGVIATETANNACIGGALIPLLTLGIPGSPPAAMLLGALMLHGVSPGPVIQLERPGFFMMIGAILLLSVIAMFINALVLTRQVVKVLRIPPTIFMPLVAILCIIGSYALGLNVFNLYLMVPVGIVCHFLTVMHYPIPPLVIGLILGPMADENLRRALMVGKGSFLPFLTRPVSLVLIGLIVLTVLTSLPAYRRVKDRLRMRFIGRTLLTNREKIK